ncbi:hypothetical protein BH11PLA2_BH11PLA2_43440 [soil metagenome]
MRKSFDGLVGRVREFRERPVKIHRTLTTIAAAFILIGDLY